MGHRPGPAGGGSSPLARGLQRRRRRRPSASRDHPRSRGVYWGSCDRSRTGDGSSPLARGLRRRALAGRSPPRIIPARAGFTGGLHPRTLDLQDHPRSRGVYVRRSVWGVTSKGSSPLARGLRGAGRRGVAHDGIIPARAGFTPPTGWRGDPPFGSSPLARGLPCPGRGTSQRCGIIPARAGFTADQIGRASCRERV